MGVVQYSLFTDFDINLFNRIDRKPISEENTKRQNQALTGFYRVTNGDNWIKNTNWLNFDVPLDDWHGVTTDSRGHVTEIRLEKNNLVGNFPTDLGRFKELEVLCLDHNKLTGHILESVLNNFEQLEVLSLRNNNLDGEVPFRVFTLMLKLREVWLGENQLTGEIHKNIGSIKSLTHFDVYNNHIRGEIPDEIGRCEKL